MIVAEPMPVHRTGVLTRGNFLHSTDEIIPHFRRVTEPVKEAGAVYEAVIAAHPQNLEAYKLLGGLRVRQKEFAAAVEAVRPFAVDVISGVESSRRVKDASLVSAFVRAAKGLPGPGQAPA